MTPPKPRHTKCPRCGDVKGRGVDFWATPEEVPCADLQTCVTNLLERIERIESRLEDHRL